MLKLEKPVWIILISMTAFLLAFFGLRKISKDGSLLPVSIRHRSGVMYFEGENRAMINQPFQLRVMIDSNNQNINAAGFYLSFDPEKISVAEVSTLKSFCQFYPEKKYDNRLGTVSLACGSPHPGVKGKNELISLTLKPLSTGTTVLRVAPTSELLLSDGRGSNILTEYPSWEVQIGAGL